MSSLVLKILGSASAKPTSNRYPSAQVLDVQGRLFLIDCGEGAQMTMCRMGISPLKIEAVFISHLHGDHLFGLFGLLSTMGMLGRTTPLKIFAPEAFDRVLDFYLSNFAGRDTYKIKFVPLAEDGGESSEAGRDGELPEAGRDGEVGDGFPEVARNGERRLNIKSPEKILDAGSIEVFAFPLRHCVPTFGYLFREKERPLNVRKEAIEEYGLTVEEIKTLKAGRDVVRNGDGDGKARVIGVEEAAYSPPRPKSFAYCSDTAPFPELASWVRGVDLLYHEATFPEEMADFAAVTGHSTTVQAATCARDADALRLVAAHFSSRYPDVGFFLDEMRRVFKNSALADDGDVFEI